jgi:mutator protein MutT
MNAERTIPEPIRVFAAVIESGGRVLICKRPSHKRHGGLWEFPGGKIEPGETDIEAAQRELNEELGLVVLGVDPADFVVADSGSEFMIEFHPTRVSGEPTCLEHSCLEWVFPEDLSKYPLAPSDELYASTLMRK